MAFDMAIGPDTTVKRLDVTSESAQPPTELRQCLTRILNRVRIRMPKQSDQCLVEVTLDLRRFAM